MNRVIILEGPDGGGKTTLAQTLRDAYGFRIEKEGVPNPAWDSDRLFRHYVGTLWKALKRDQPVVFDRHYLGETIYGPVMRGRSLLSPQQVRLIERLVRARDVRVVLVLPPRPVVVDNWKAKHADYVDGEERLHQIYSRYEDLSCSDPYVDYDYRRGTSIDTEKNELTDDEQWLNLWAPRGRLPNDVIGSPQAKFLLVGEQINQNATSTDWPFFATTNSSGFLNQALENLPESDLAFINALDTFDAVKPLNQVVARLPNFQAAIALGRVASKALLKLKIFHHQVPHPSHVRRFNASKLKEYTCLFEQILSQPKEQLCVTKL